jgi:hypothetical protein
MFFNSNEKVNGLTNEIIKPMNTSPVEKLLQTQGNSEEF